MGHTEEAPYDAIHVGAAAPTVPQAVSLSEHTLKSDNHFKLFQFTLKQATIINK